MVAEETVIEETVVEDIDTGDVVVTESVTETTVSEQADVEGPPLEATMEPAGPAVLEEPAPAWTAEADVVAPPEEAAAPLVEEHPGAPRAWDKWEHERSLRASPSRSRRRLRSSRR